MTLTLDELKQMTGRVQGKAMKRCLDAAGFKSIMGPDGYPVVSREHVQLVLSGVIDPATATATAKIKPAAGNVERLRAKLRPQI